MRILRCTSLLLLAALSVTTTTIHALSTPVPKPRGCAATPLNKQKIAVLGAGGYLGSYIFGFLQRASSLYGTGMGGIYSPRTICATAQSSYIMNKVLGRHFSLAYAGEQHVRLTDMESVEAIATRLEGYGAVILGTKYGLEVRPVSPGSYETSPNSKTLEFSLDRPRTGDMGDEYDVDVHLNLFDNTMQACYEANVGHVVVIETPDTPSPEEFVARLETSNVPYTYLRLQGDLENSVDHMHYKGIQGDLDIVQSSITTEPASSSGSSPIYREDLAAIVCQSLQSLPWSESRCLDISSKGPWDGAIQTVKGRLDREWCGNQGVIAAKLASIQ